MGIEIAPGVVADPKIRFGRPVLEGTRVPVHVVLAKLAAGMPPKEVAVEYGLTLKQVRAALAYAAKVLEQEQIRAVR